MTQTVWTVTCRGCDWQPDPKRRMDPDNQAEEHTKAEGHVTVTHCRPVVTR